MNTHHNNKYIWVDSDGSGGWKVPSKGDYTITPESDEDGADEDLIDGDDR